MNKLIISTLLIVGLVGMIGTAAALPTTVTGLIEDTSGNGVGEATVTVYEGPSCTGNVLGTATSQASGDYIIDAGNLDPLATITVCAAHTTEGSGSTTTTAGTAGATYSDGINVAIVKVSIPEFPTIALPIAAILGLMFIISSRKKKE